MTTAQHPKTQFQQQDNQLVIANKTLSQLETLVGGTPFYAYNKKLIADKISALKESLPTKIKLHYAIKANPYPPLVHFIQPLVSGFDVASKNEMLLALQTGIDKQDISFAGPGKSDKDLESAIIAEVTLHVESSNEIKRITELAQQLKLTANIAIRINPSFELKGSGMRMGGGAKPFGIDEEQVVAVIQNLDDKHLNLRGLHIFAGSQSLSAEAIIQMHQETFALAAKLLDLLPQPLDYINIGGGLGIPYFANEKPLELDDISQNLDQLIKKYPKVAATDLIMELGRYLVGEAGIYVSKVIDKKVSREQTYLVCNGGLHHHLANSGNLGQIIRKNYPVAIGNKLYAEQANQEQVNVVGPLCTPLDILAQSITLPKADIGDFMVIYQSGAYGASASPQKFLSQTPVYEILI